MPKTCYRCANHYDPDTRCIKKVLREVLVRINRSSVYLAFQIPHKEPYETQMFEELECLYVERKGSFDSNVAQSWLLKPIEGDSRLPKSLTIEHFIKEIANIVLLLNRIKGNEHAFHWESWMYFFIQKIVEGSKLIDWVEMIAENLHKGLVEVKNFGPFFLSSYLIYILAASKEWKNLPHAPWTDEMPIYQY